MKNNKKIVMSKDNFIDFLASATPEEINQYIIEKGKPGKLIDPMNIRKKENSKNNL